LEYERELREAEQAKQMEANRVNALLQGPKWNLPSPPSPPIVIVGTGQKIEMGKASQSAQSAESPVYFSGDNCSPPVSDDDGS